MDIKVNKIELHQQCLRLIKQQAEKLNNAIKALQEASNNDTKSSAGDKFETGRAMVQLEKDKYTQQLARTLLLNKVLHQINPNEAFSNVGLGSVVVTNNGSFYISVSLGEIEVEGVKIIAISPVAPIGQLLNKKKVGDTIMFNKRTYTILRII